MNVMPALQGYGEFNYYNNKSSLGHHAVERAAARSAIPAAR